MRIRPVVAGDLPPLHNMMCALSAYHGDITPSTVELMARDMLDDPPWVRVLVAEEGNALVGYVAILPLANVNKGRRGIDIHHLYINEAWRGQGIGKSLIEAALSLGRDLQCSYAFITTMPENIAAQKAYLACGFESWSSKSYKFRRDIEPDGLAG